jgi:hypothetical protein
MGVQRPLYQESSNKMWQLQGTIILQTNCIHIYVINCILLCSNILSISLYIIPRKMRNVNKRNVLTAIEYINRNLKKNCLENNFENIGTKSLLCTMYVCETSILRPENFVMSADKYLLLRKLSICFKAHFESHVQPLALVLWSSAYSHTVVLHIILANKTDYCPNKTKRQVFLSGPEDVFVSQGLALHWMEGRSRV